MFWFCLMRYFYVLLWHEDSLFMIKDMNHQKTERQFTEALDKCREIFVAKLGDYSASWRLLRPSSITDQIFIKAKRIRTLETEKTAMIDEGILPEFMAIVNYGIIGLIQLNNPYVDEVDVTTAEAIALYDKYASEAKRLMIAKNHDYNEAWRGMRVSTYTDFILTKVQRAKEIENNGGATKVSEGIDSNYMDMINYGVFGVIKLS